MHHIRHGEIKLKRLFKDVLEGNWPVDMIEIKRNNRGKIKGLQITNGRVRNLWFDKVK